MIDRHLGILFLACLLLPCNVSGDPRPDNLLFVANQMEHSVLLLDPEGDRNGIDPLLGSLSDNGGPTQTQGLLPGSPAIDAGNPTGCTDINGHLLKTDQRGEPRPNREDSGGCDIGAFESQRD